MPAEAVPPEARVRHTLLLPLVFGSGAAALIYEVVWLQMLQLVVGSTAVSLGVLLGTYMGGMCVGSLLLPRVVGRRLHPLRVYALLELGVAACAVGVLYGLPFVERIYAGVAGSGGWTASLALRGLVSVVCLLPPTVLMGATLPAIARWVGSTREGVAWVGFLYGANIVGAVFGCLAAGFCLLRVYDVATATYVAVALDVLVAAGCLLLSAAWVYLRPVADEPAAEATAAAPAGIYVAIALSGLTALGAEVVWTRALSLLLGGTVYTFSIVLAIFLVGLGIGSLVGSFIGRSWRPWLSLGVCQLLLAGTVTWAAWALADSLPFWPLNPSLSISPWFTFQTDLAACLWTVLPGAVLWGASFPIALAAAAGPDRDPARLVAGIYAANTVGAIAGSLGFSLVLVPALGTQWSQRVLLVLAVAAGAVVLVPRLRERRRLVPAAALVAALVLAPLLVRAVAPVPWAVTAFGRYCATWLPQLYPGVLQKDQFALLQQASAWGVDLRASGDTVTCEPKAAGQATALIRSALGTQAEDWASANRADLLSTLHKGWRAGGDTFTSAAYGGGEADRYCIYLGEGTNVSVAVTESSDGTLYFHGAGKVQASTAPQDMRLQRMLGHLTMLARKDPDSVHSVLVVACGAGVTAGSFVPYRSVRRIVICDIERIVPEHVAPMFARENYNVVDDPRTQVIIDDGRHFVRTTKEKFDVITSDPIDPWVKGCAALNTVEYYQMCKEHLNPGGIMALWFPLYQSDERTLKSAIATFFKVFPSGVIYSNDSSGSGYDMVLFAQVDPVEKVDVDRLQSWIDAHPDVDGSLKDVDFGAGAGVAVDLLATYAGQAKDVAGWLKGAELNTDRNLRLQYLAGLAVDENQSDKLFAEILTCYKFPGNLYEGTSQTMQALQKAIEGPRKKQ
jgi:spermidine synthase